MAAEADVPSPEVAMGIMLSERRKLRGIERGIANTQPLLADRYRMFSELCRDEDMPRIEQLKARAIEQLKARALLRRVAVAADRSGNGR